MAKEKKTMSSPDLAGEIARRFVASKISPVAKVMLLKELLVALATCTETLTKASKHPNAGKFGAPYWIESGGACYAATKVLFDVSEIASQ